MALKPILIWAFLGDRSLIVLFHIMVKFPFTYSQNPVYPWKFVGQNLSLLTYIKGSGKAKMAIRNVAVIINTVPIKKPYQMFQLSVSAKISTGQFLLTN